MVQKQESPRTLTGGQAVQSSTHQKSLVDWVQVTFKGEKTWLEICTLLGLQKVEFNRFESGYYGYPNMYGMGNINIMFKDDLREYHIQMTGQGCRMFEQVSEITWYELFSIVHHDQDAKFTRLDLAIDDFNQSFTIPTIRRKMKRGELVTKFLEGDSTEAFRFSSNNQDNSEVVGDGVRFGSPKSRLMIRMYDKVKERNNAGFELTVKTWVRVELQLRKEYANEAIKELLDSDFAVGIVAKGYLKEYLRFVDKPNKGKDTNKRRWNVSNFWSKYLGKVESLKLSLEAPDHTIERSIKWLDHSIAPTFATVLEAKGESFMDMFVDDLKKQGKKRMKKKHEVMVNDHLEKEKVQREINKNKMNEVKRKMASIRKNRNQLHRKKHENACMNYNMENKMKLSEDYPSVLEKKKPRIKYLDNENNE